MRHLRYLLPLAALIGLLVVGCGGKSTKKVGKEDIARVGSAAITRAQFDEILKQAQKSYASQKRVFPKAGSADYAALQNQVVSFLVQREEFAQKADELGVKVTDKNVEDRLKQVKQQYFGGDEKKYLTQLASQGLTDSTVHQDIRSQLVSEGLFNKVTKDVKVTDQEISDYYTANPSQYTQPQSRDVRHILVKTKALADKIYGELKGGADFAKLAKKYSIDPGSKAQGGKLTVSKGQTVPEFDKVAFELKTDELAKPVKTQYGWHVIEAVSNVKPRKTTPVAQVTEAIRQQLLQQKRSELMTKWVEDVKAEFTPQVAYQTGFAPPPTTSTATTTTHSPNNGGNG